MEQTRNNDRRLYFNKQNQPEVLCRRACRHVRPIIQCDMSGNLIREWPAIADAGRKLGIERRNIGACCRNKRKSAGGYTWRYVE